MKLQPTHNIYWTAKETQKNNFILIYLEKGAWYTLLMNKFIESNFLQNLNKIFMAINTMEVAEIQVLTMLLL